MTRTLVLAAVLGLCPILAGCGGGSTTPEKVTPEIEAAQNQAQQQAEDDERKEFKAPAKKKK